MVVRWRLEGQVRKLRDAQITGGTGSQDSTRGSLRENAAARNLLVDSSL